MDFGQVIAAVVIVLCIVCICALLLGALMAGRRAALARELEEVRTAPVRAAWAQRDEALRQGPSGARVRELRVGQSGLDDRRAHVIPLPQRTRLDRAALQYRKARGVKVDPWNVSGGGAA
jgi:hypothetical protein